ncbi:YceI family protein [Aquirhabdus parva]|nr:YceI family protein [Aquirhabdus parva]
MQTTIRDQRKYSFIRMLVTGVCLTFSAVQTALAADWQIDPSQTHFHFKTRGLIQTEGSFSRFSGAIKGDVFDPAHLELTFTIQADSASTGSSMTDGMLKGSSFFNVEKYPEMTFKTTQITQVDPAHSKVRGELTMVGITKPIEFKVNLSTPLVDPITHTVTIKTSTSFLLDRNQWGMSSYGSFVNKNIEVQVDSAMVSNNVDPEVIAKLTEKP